MTTQDKRRPCKFSIVAFFSPQKNFSELEFTGPLDLRGTDPQSSQEKDHLEEDHHRWGLILQHSCTRSIRWRTHDLRVI